MTDPWAEGGNLGGNMSKVKRGTKKRNVFV